MGIYHQGGVVPTQAWLGQQKDLATNIGEVMWWRTYSPPVWLLDHNPIQTTDLMGTPFALMQHRVDLALAEEQGEGKTAVGLVAPYSSMELEDSSWGERKMLLEEVYRYGRHLNLDDLDVGREGVWGTLKRVVGRRGLIVWRISRIPHRDGVGSGIMHGDW